MAYIPPHKRHSKDSERPTRMPMPMPSPPPASIIPLFKRNMNLRASRSNAYRSGWIVYSNYATKRWFAVSGTDDNVDDSPAHLKPVSVESIERGRDMKLSILVKPKGACVLGEAKGSLCSSITEIVIPDLLSSFENVRDEIKGGDLKDVKLKMAARFGNILFQGNPSVNLESVTKDCLRKLKRIFYTNLPASYAANIISDVALKIGVDFAGVKDTYQVKLSDSIQPKSTIFCKCRVKDGKKLQLYKVELNQMRDMAIDISCMDMDLDLRLALSHTRIVTSMLEDEMQSIRNLIDSAVLDSGVKGGLRWPFGKASSDNRYTVIAAWHTKATAFVNATTKLKVQLADRFDFRTTSGEASNEVVLKLKGITLGLMEQDVETSVISDMLKDTLSLIWQHFLHCETVKHF